MFIIEKLKPKNKKVKLDPNNLKVEEKSLIDIYSELKERNPNSNESFISEKANELYKQQYETLSQYRSSIQGKTEYNINDYSKLNLSSMLSSTISNSKSNIYSTDILDPEKIQVLLEYPSRYEGEMIQRVSQTLRRVSQDYKTLIKTMTSTMKYQFVLNPKSDNVTTKQFMNQLNLLESFKYKQVFDRATKKAMMNDMYCGYLQTKRGSNKRSIFDLNTDYCHLAGKDSYDNYIYWFDLTYFTGLTKHEIEQMPDDIIKEYYAYKEAQKKNKGKKDKQIRIGKRMATVPESYCLLPVKNQLCVKLDVTTDYILPWFSGVFVETLKYDLLKDQNFEDSMVENFKLIHQKIPVYTKESGMDEMQLNPDLIDYYHSEVTDAVGGKAGVATTAMDLEAVSLKQTAQQLINTSKFGLENIYSGAGVNEQLVNSSKAGSTGVNKNMLINESFMFTLYRQYEGFLNKLVTNNTNSHNYKVTLLDLTENNYKDKFDKYLTAGQSGMNKSYAPACLGIGQSDLIHGLKMEDKLDFEKLLSRPFISSHLSSQDLDVTKDGGSGNDNAVKEEVGDEADRKRNEG